MTSLGTSPRRLRKEGVASTTLQKSCPNTSANGLVMRRSLKGRLLGEERREVH